MASDSDESPLDLTDGDLADRSNSNARSPGLGTLSGTLSGTGDSALLASLDANQLRLQVKQLKQELQNEQDMVAQLRKRLNSSDRDKLESTSKVNTEISSLESTIAKLRAQVEKGEAIRHNLEYELTMAKRDLSKQKSTAAEREAALSEANDELRQKLNDAGDELKRLQKQAKTLKKNAEDTERRLKETIDERDQLMADWQSETELLKTERDKLDTLVLKQESAMAELNKRINEIENERKEQGNVLRRTVAELEYAKEREDRMKKELESALQRIKGLEESVEAERAAHLETKFNSEIIQLRVKDLESGMDVEKSANAEANKALERLTKQLRELEQAYETERKTKRDAVHKLERLDKEYVTVRRQLTAELEDKKVVIVRLSKELDLHQTNLNELKEELMKAKKRQAYLEETYGGSIRELDQLIQNFTLDSKRARMKREEAKVKKTPNPSAVLDALRNTLLEFKKKIDTTTDDLSKSKKTNEKMAKEIESCREMIKAKDKSLEDAQRNYTRTAKELNRVRTEFGELEALLTRLKMDMQTSSTHQNKDRQRIQELSEEVIKMVKKHKTEEEERVAFLHSLYQRLMIGRIAVPSKDPRSINTFSWDDLTEVVYEQISSLVTTYQGNSEKLKTTEEQLRMRDVQMEEAQHTHEDQLNKLSTLARERETCWQKQKAELEDHYNKMVQELQARAKKSQALADQAWEKIRATGSVQQGLESECSQVNSALQAEQTKSSALLTACALLCGAIYPLYSRFNELAAERRLLEEQMAIWDVCRERAQYLVGVLDAELTHDPELPEREGRTRRPRNPLLVFRIGVVAVMAANRLWHMRQASCKMFVTYETVTGHNGLMVCTGGVRQPRRPFRGLAWNRDEEEEEAEEDEDQVPPGERHLLEFLSSPALVDICLSSTLELQEIASQVKQSAGGNPAENRALVSAARSCFSKLLDKVGTLFPNLSLQPMQALRDRSSLVRRLGRSLGRALSGKPISQKDNLLSSQDLMIALQNHILDFTQRLHKVEVDRRELLETLEAVKREKDQTAQQSDSQPPSEDQLPKTVSLERFEKVWQELNAAMKREQQAQHLLSEQSRQLEDLTLKLDLFSTEGKEKENTLSEALQGLRDSRSELRKKEQVVRQLNKQIMQMDFDRKSLQENLGDAENALQQASRDKEILAKYIKSVKKALDDAKVQISMMKDAEESIALPSLLLNAEFIPDDIGGAGGEIIACQGLVGSFLEVHHAAVARLKALQAEIQSHRQHVSTMKQELTNAVRREMAAPEAAMSHDDFEMQSTSEQDDTGKFYPLREDSEISFALAKPDSPGKMQTPKKAASGRSPGYTAPLRSMKSQPRRPEAGHR